MTKCNLKIPDLTIELFKVNNLPGWISDQLKVKGWSMRELARRANVSHTTVTDVVNKSRQPTWEFCVSIAKVFGEKPEVIFQLAGLSKDKPNPEPTEKDMLRDIWSALNRAFIIADPEELAEAKRKLAQIGERPDYEVLYELWRELDALERRNVYDYIRWRLGQQLERLNSSEQKNKELERQQNIIIAEFLETMHALTPKERGDVIAYLQELNKQSGGVQT